MTKCLFMLKRFSSGLSKRLNVYSKSEIEWEALINYDVLSQFFSIIFDYNIQLT